MASSNGSSLPESVRTLSRGELAANTASGDSGAVQRKRTGSSVMLTDNITSSESPRLRVFHWLHVRVLLWPFAMPSSTSGSTPLISCACASCNSRAKEATTFLACPRYNHRAVSCDATDHVPFSKVVESVRLAHCRIAKSSIRRTSLMPVMVSRSAVQSETVARTREMRVMILQTNGLGRVAVGCLSRRRISSCSPLPFST